VRRKDIPEALTHLALWPGVDPSALSAAVRKQYRQREEATRAYMGGEPLASIERRFGMHGNTLVSLLNRCIAPHPDGRIQGFRGLVPFARVCPRNLFSAPCARTTC
jgi:putative transposase